MNNYKLKIQYDGAKYKGWQRLGNTDMTIQGKIESVLSKYLDKNIEITGASRTDAGVHALNQIANFKTEEDLNEEDIKKYLNKYLPNDISIIEVNKVSENFHARYNAGRKTYIYKIWNKEYPDPFLRRYSLHIEEKLDIKNMEEVAKELIGEHDFTAFTNAKSKKKSMVREVYTIEILEKNGLLELKYIANGFLHNMVRKITGTLLDAGLNKIKASDVKKIIESKKRNLGGIPAEAKGLYLVDISY